MEITNLLLIIVGLINLYLSYFILRKSRDRSNRYFALLLFGIVVWTFSMLFFRTSNDPDVIYSWGKMVYVGAALTGFSFLAFSIIFPDQKIISRLYRSTFVLFALLFVAISFLSVFGNFIIVRAETVNGINTLVYNYGNIFYGLYILTSYFVGFGILLKKRMNYTGRLKLQFNYILLGTLSSLTVGMYLNFYLTFNGDFSYNWLGPCSSILMIGFIAYAIVKHRLMGMVVLLSKVYLILIISIYIYVVFQVFVFIHYFFASADSSQLQIISFDFILCVIAAIALLPFINYIQKSSDYLFYRGNKPSEMIKELSLKLSGLIDIKELVKILNIEFKKLIGSDDFYIVYMPKPKSNVKKDSYELALYKNESFRNIDIPRDSKIVQTVMKNKELLVTDEIEDLKENHALVKELKKYEAKIVSPLQVKNRIIGAFIFGRKVTQNAYTKEDIDFIEIISSQAAIAIDNARLYKEIKDFNTRLKMEVARATKNLQAANDELKSVNEKLVVAYEKLHKLDRAKSEFLSIASHQLRTPLTSIKGFTSMILEGTYGKVSVDVRKVLEKVFLSNERLIRLVEDLLNISRIESGKFVFELKKQDIELLIDEVLESFVVPAKTKNIKIEFKKVGRKPAKFYFDKNKIREVLSNFIDNALKYSEKGPIVVQLKNQKDMVRVSVKDHGLGVPEGELEYIFDKFQRGKGVNQVHTEGVGLGLYVCRKIIEAHKGRIWAESDGLGKGSTFVFELQKKIKPKDFEK